MKKKKKASQKSINEHKIHFYRQVAFTFIGAAIVVLIGLLYFSLSQALILITPSLEEVKADFNLLVRTETAMTQEGVEAELVFTDITIERTADSERLEEGEDQKATGTITIINSSNKPQPLVKTTRFLSEEGVLFRLENGVTVPANGEVQAEVYADAAGKSGEIGPTIFTIPGLNQTRQQEVHAKSDESMEGGTRAIYKVTREAVDQALEDARAIIISRAKAQLEEQGVETNRFLPGTQYIEVISEEFSPEIGSSAEEFTVKLVARVPFVLADRADLVELAQAQLYTTTNLGYELSSSDEGSFTYSITNFDSDNGTAQLHVILSGQKRMSANHPILDVVNFVGEKPSNVKSQLEADPGIDNVEIELRPFWLRKVPRLIDHIYIQFSS